MLATTTRFKKPIAWFFASIFYLELIVPSVSARASALEYIPGNEPVRLITWRDIAATTTGKNINAVAYKHIGTDEIKNKAIAGNKRPASLKGPGPTQPEMQAFSSVNANNMVDLFSGDFSYNIPLLDVGGYPVNISYRSGISMDQEASWCGLGWNINPGTITRNLRGLPDDFSGSDSIRKVTSIKENKTVGVSGGIDLEIAGAPLSLGASLGVFHNNYKGWGIENSVNASISAGVGSSGALSGGLSLNNNSQEGLTITPSITVSLTQKGAEESNGIGGSLGISAPYNSRSGLKTLQLSAGLRQYIGFYNNDKFQKQRFSKGHSSTISFASPTTMPTISMPFTSSQFSFTGKVGTEFSVVHPAVFVSGYVSRQRIDRADTLQTLPAYGYLHYQDGNKTKNPLLDFNREKELMYRDKPPVPHIAVPFYTYDAFSITGEGTGGMFRAYRGDIGYVHDHFMRTKNESDGASVDVGIGNLVHAGVDVNESYSFTQNSAWLEENSINSLISFKENDGKFEGAYFRNPGEKAINAKSFYESLGGDDVVTVEIKQSGSSSPVIQATNNLVRYHDKKKVGTNVLTRQNTVKAERDKRSQVISYLTAKEASIVGLNKYIENYGLNNFDLNNCTTGAGEPDGPHGLAAEYYMTRDFQGYVDKRIESTINFDWQKTGPVFYLILPPLPNGPIIPPLPINSISDRFSMRWLGRIKAPVTGTYTFTTSSDDGVRLWINDSLLINRWNDHPATADNVTLNLVEGEMYKIRMEYYENKGNASVRLEWAYPGQSKQVIPEIAFYLPPTDGFTFNSNLELERRVTGYRKENHISEVDVLNPDGRRYVYGIPVYNFKQKEATFSVNNAGGNINTGLAKYQHGIDNTTANDKGQDNYFNSEEIPAYAHSFLLTGILSPDYVDVTGNGVSDDDLGDAVKFKYSKINGIANPFKWRAPYVKDSVTYNEGLKTDSRDDKGSYTYGEKELWYLHSIESKTMIATFVTENRLDQLAIDESGKKYNDGSAKRLKEINLYSKADFLKNGVNAKPIKTVHFDYTYELCRGYNKPVNDSGKLTLKRIWFTYNKNQKVRQNPYVFNYNSKNPSYDLKSYDRWGNYKDPLENPGSVPGNIITNAEYPYAIQDSAVAAHNAAAWALDSIYLPSGGSLKVTYEGDDYAYVQNKRAMQLFKIGGLGSAPGLTNPVQRLYSGDNEHLYVYVKVPSPVTSKNEVYRKYLKGVSKLYFKLFVEMPTDRYGNGYEYVSCYANLDADNYGIVSGHPDMLWVKITGVSLKGDKPGDYSPLAKAAIQFLRLNLPSKAYTGSQVGDNLDAQAAVQMMVALADNVKSTFTSFDRTARDKGWAVKIDTGRSFIRLNTPEYLKYGGGYRVKRITVYDNWNKMTGGREAVYGQDYIYKTIQKIDGQDKLISSGVTNWEPGIGGEENPFREPIEYTEEISILGPVAMGYSEEPLGESLFPSPQVGYSKVRVRTINHKNIRSANGYAETGFYTAYDFPVYTDRTLIDSDTKKRFKPAISNFLKINAKYYLGISQGFKVELNDMHGKLRYEASYSENKPNEPISYTENIYRVENAQTDQKRLSNTVISMMPDGSIDTSSLVGKEVELMVDMREQLSVTSGNNTSVNAEVFSVPFIPFFMVIPSFFRMPQREENKFRSVATTKVIQRYGILDSVIHIDKGSKISTRDLMYDAETGEVILTRTQNEFNDPVYNFSYPAHWAYDGMGLAYKNISTVVRHLSFSKGKITAGLSVPETALFSSGDEILVAGKQFTGTSGCTTFASFAGYSKIWAFDSAVTGKGTSKFYFIDAEGKPYTASDVSIKITRSGRKNMGGAVGAVTLLTNPLVKNGSQYELKIDTGSLVVNASANEFRNIWQVQDLKKRTQEITIKDTIPADCNADTSCTCKCLKKLFDYLIQSKRLFVKSNQNITVGQIVQDANNAGYNVSVSDCNLLLRNQFKPFFARTGDSITNRYIAQLGDCIVKISSSDTTVVSLYSLRSLPCDSTTVVQYYDSLSDSCRGAFAKTYGGSGTDEFSDLKQTFDGGFIMAGSTSSFGSGGKDGYIVKTDNNGNVSWAKTYGGSDEDYFYKIRQTNDSGYIAIGTRMSSRQPQGEVFVVKTDSDGVVLWARGFAQNTMNGEAGYDVIQTSDEGYALAGIYNFAPNYADIEVLKLTGTGNISWAKTFGGYSSDNLGGIVEIQDTLYFGGFGVSSSYSLTGGGNPSSTAYDALLVKINKNTGDFFWAKSYDLGSKSNWISQIKPSSAGILLDVTNMTDYAGQDGYNVLFELDRNGNPVKNIRLGSDSVDQSFITGSAQTYDGGIVTGQLRTDASGNANLQKVASNGSAAWGNSLSKPGLQQLRQAIQNNDGTFTAIGSDGSKALAIKTDLVGKTYCADSAFMFDVSSLTVTKYDLSMTPASLSFSDINISVTAGNATPSVAAWCSNPACSVDSTPVATLQIESCQSRDTIIGISCESIVKDTATNPFVTGILGNWRSDKSYAYYAARKQSDPTADVNLRTDGTVKDYAGFWEFDNGKLKPQYDTTRWVWNSRITMFSQKGFELENKDPLNRYNAALYGYNETLPIAVVQNSQYREAAFDGFEDYGFATRICDTSCPADRHFDCSAYISKITTAEKHSGKSSIKLNAFEQAGLTFELVDIAEDTAHSSLAIETGTDACASGTIVKAIRADSTFIKPSFSPFAGRKMLVSAWVKEEQECSCSTYVYNQIRVLSDGGTGAEVILKPSGAIIEGWQRYEGVFTSAANDTEITVSLEATGEVSVYFDDLRIQPFNANMKSFVYDPVNLRLMAELDENNYTTFYEYDDDGTLIRVKKETERGIQTIKETRSALLKQ